MYKTRCSRSDDGKPNSPPCRDGQRKTCWSSFHARLNQATLSSFFEIIEEDPLLTLFGKSML